MRIIYSRNNTIRVILLFMICMLVQLLHAQTVVFENEGCTNNYSVNNYEGVLFKTVLKVGNYQNRKIDVGVYLYDARQEYDLMLLGSIKAPAYVKEKGQLCRKRNELNVDYQNTIWNNLTFFINNDYFPRFIKNKWIRYVFIVKDSETGTILGKSDASVFLFKPNICNPFTTTENNDKGEVVKKEEGMDGIVFQTTYQKCYSCHSTLRCSSCGGVGKRLSRYARVPSSCFSCHGSGQCSSCNGGYIAMRYKTYLDLSLANNRFSSSFPNSGSYPSSSHSGGVNTSKGDCSKCGGSGQCMKCFGKGYYYDAKWTNSERKCYCVNGRCSTCNGSGKR